MDIDSVVDHAINISTYKPSCGSSYIRLPKELDHLKKSLINIQNLDGNKCFKWCLVRYLYPADYDTAKVDKDFARELDFKDPKFPVKIRDIHKIEKKNCNSNSVFGYENKKKISNLRVKNIFKRHVRLLLIRQEGKRQYVLIKGFNTFIYNHTLHRRRKHFCRYCLQAFSTAEMLKSHVN